MHASSIFSRAFPVLEAIYSVEQSREAWHAGVLRAAAGAFDRGRGVGLVLYQRQNDSVNVNTIGGVNLPPGHLEIGQKHHNLPDVTRRIFDSYGKHVCVTMPEQMGDPEHWARMRADYVAVGIKDQILINGLNPCGTGCCLYVFSGDDLALSAVERAMFTRLARHLATAYRLQRRLEGGLESSETHAVLRMDGRVEHAQAEASSTEARESLTQAVLLREQSRRSHRQDAPEDLGFTAFRPMVEARWTLLDHHEPDGKRYVTARANAPVFASRSPLSHRETQVASLATLGQTNKVIAYELGLADSTVRVLLARAAAKLGVRTRQELIERYRALRPSSADGSAESPTGEPVLPLNPKAR